MGRFLVSRLLQAAITLFLLSLLVFILSRAIGNPLDIMLPPDAPAEVRERLTDIMVSEKWSRGLVIYAGHELREIDGLSLVPLSHFLLHPEQVLGRA